LGTAFIGGLALLFSSLHASPLLADDDDHGYYEHDDDEHEYEYEHDHDRALQALKCGEVQPLEKVLAAIRSSIDGTIVRTKLERKRGVWVYKLKVLGRDGRMRQINVDAKTVKLLLDKKR
jgi:uncharacterized membrane protein YkoI